MVRSYRVLAEQMLLSTCVERMRVAPFGLKGGADGLPFRIRLERDGQTQPISGKANIVLRRDDVVTIESSGGGGFGPV